MKSLNLEIVLFLPSFPFSPAIWPDQWLVMFLFQVNTHDLTPDCEWLNDYREL